MTLLKSFKLGISYSRIYLVDADNPPSVGLYFEDQHYHQGFAWCPYEVEFDVDFSLNNLEATCGLFEVHLAEEIEVSSDSTRAILLPFTVKKKGVYVSDTFGASVDVLIPEGQYALLFEFKPRDDSEYISSAEYQEDLSSGFIQIWVRFTFVPQQNVEPAILKADKFIDPVYPLLMEADPV
jgi:hypothetical protein